ncbi:hypothetical protein BDZ45DRAFT_739940 [Acephala macrosclerotiorum]|nr:hypothetical protein BDZ45DRAFT_739940 [Acephala macrosclerotiorum]
MARSLCMILHSITYTTARDPFDRLAPAYDVLPKPMAKSYWKPRPDLTHPEFSTLTLLFVSSLRIYYKKWSEDPISPADKEVFLPGERKSWFRNSDPRARPFACINSIEVCLGDGIACWPINGLNLLKDTSNKTLSAPPEFWLMFASLRRTDVYNTIEKYLGRGLISQSKVSQFFPDASGNYHWVDEVGRLVATSHARTQINAWSIASGEDSVHKGKGGHTLITPEEKYGDFCGMFKYNPPGQEEPAPQPAHPAAIGSEAEVAPERPEARSVGQEEPAPQPTDLVATSSQTEETTPGAVNEPPIATLVERVASQRVETRGETTDVSTDDSADVVWEPLLNEKIIELLSFPLYRWPRNAYDWLRLHLR